MNEENEDIIRFANQILLAVITVARLGGVSLEDLILKKKF